ncbi:phosphatase PAP2 family protein [Aliidiomarina soli]|uniref:undecaprenyl-diphosphate phosphatase n=1 Tax=Aliidiomarina soli TaxID=1928574 RepID=A0A432WIG4_9GAMM|nr:phosphatase PAP2 family protein [Aliidiomarina soli]RUO33612.1 phosphatase PAP2 family protein [Aliidiomarina soli]
MKWLDYIQRYDEVSYRWFSGTWQCRPKVVLARVVSMSGDGWMYALLCAGLVLTEQPGASTMFWLLCLTFAVELPVYVVLKNTLRRQRPYQRLKICAVIQASDKFSFPSGHTTGAFVFAIIASHFFPQAAPWLITWAVTIGLSRVALGVHYPTDILAGAGLGSGFAYLALITMELI